MDEQTNNLILAIYGTVTEPDTWPDVLQRVSREVGAMGAMVLDLHTSSSLNQIQLTHCSNDYRHEDVTRYFQRFQEQELADQERRALEFLNRDGIDLVDDSAIAGSEEELLKRENIQAMIRAGVYHRVGALLNKDDFWRDRFTLQFSKEHGPMTDEEHVRAKLLLPHMAKALYLGRTNQESNRRESLYTDAIDRLRIGVGILSKSRQLIFANKELERQIQEYNDFQRGKDGALTFTNQEVAAGVESLMHDNGAHGKFGARPRKEALISPLEGDTFALCIEIMPARSSEVTGDSNFEGFVIFSLDTSKGYGLDTELMRSLYSLTPSEIEVLELLAEGKTNQQIGDERSKSVHTINTQVKNILSKTYAENRTQLIRLATNVSSSFTDE